MMDFKLLIVLTFIVSYAISLNTTLEGSDETKTYCSMEMLEKVFMTYMGEDIVQYLNYDDLMDIKTIKVMSKAACFELNRRSKILHLRDGRITPSYLAKALGCKTQLNLTNDEYICNFTRQYWSPYKAVLFDSKISSLYAKMLQYSYVLLIVTHEDHLEIIYEVTSVDNKNSSFNSDEIKESSMQGIIIPWYLHYAFGNDLEILFINEIRNKNPDLIYQMIKDFYFQIKLVIVIASDDQSTHEKAENRTLAIAQTISNDLKGTPVCFAAQSDTREKDKLFTKYQDYAYFFNHKDNVVLFFDGSEISASIFVVNTTNENEMKKNLLKWMKDDLDFLNTHQTIAFHLTTVNGTEPENSEQIFSETFPNIPLSTLRLLGEPSITGAIYQGEMEINAGPVYAIVGIRKYGCGRFLEEN